MSKAVVVAVVQLYEEALRELEGVPEHFGQGLHLHVNEAFSLVGVD